ncbi:hypothetical protein A4G99_07030 [Haladaptatus sp. R4]|uniref:helix-turn-helix domain-containing protein n=1 Tax=Haladaptatus sp. R4 TaxID=1679489 RepID=UPI0007B4A649|nr:helix-turn-helix domain-containing protein [Haladaptatus sp. R4]KZN24189.1 hypothetical protein A4G99_07030 [Haladaptatus sp. R4]
MTQENQDHEIDDQHIETLIDQLEAPHQNKTVLTHLYVECVYNTYECADILSVSQRTVRKWLKDWNIPRRGHGGRKKTHPSFTSFTPKDNDYIHVQSGDKTAYIHQLNLIADGHDPNDVFGKDNHVHHIDGIKYHNLPENLTLMDVSKHHKHHNDVMYADSPWRNQEVMQALVDEKVSIQYASDIIDCNDATIREWRNKFDLEGDTLRRDNNEVTPWRNPVILRYLIEEEGIQLKQASERFDVDPSTLTKYTNLHEIDVPNGSQRDIMRKVRELQQRNSGFMEADD